MKNKYPLPLIYLTFEPLQPVSMFSYTIPLLEFNFQSGRVNAGREKIRAVVEWPALKTQKEFHQIPWICQLRPWDYPWHSKISSPFTILTLNSMRFMSLDANKAFEKFKLLSANGLLWKWLPVSLGLHPWSQLQPIPFSPTDSCLRRTLKPWGIKSYWRLSWV